MNANSAKSGGMCALCSLLAPTPASRLSRVSRVSGAALALALSDEGAAWRDNGNGKLTWHV
jgi:hypothetical protein